MKIQDEKLAKRLAEDYLTGGMSTRARSRYERMLRRDEGLKAPLDRLQNRLLNLYQLLPGRKPRAQVWQGIEQRLFAAKQGVSAFWSYWAVAASMVSLVLLGWVFNLNTQMSLPQTQYVAVLSLENQQPSWVVSIKPGTHQMVMTSIQPKALDAQHAYELWVIPEGSQTPKSLGLLPVGEHMEMAMKEPVMGDMKKPMTLAVTVEQAGGSPTGLPTSQPILLSGLYLANP
jgi:anti-sigma-K factor RskA